MTISEDTIRRAAEAMYNTEPGIYISWEDQEQVVRDIWTFEVRAALPILRDAIREELVQEMIADAQSDGGNGGIFLPARKLYLYDWLRTYFPESESQP